MADDKLTVRDPFGNEIEIDPSARPFWEHREGHQILDAPASGDASSADASEAAESARPKPPAKAAVRPAIESKE